MKIFTLLLLVLVGENAGPPTELSAYSQWEQTIFIFQVFKK